ncbi:MAG: hypothetical protein M1830_008774 [Pleopsidium flavum]|nr:MAG: hypothetical protein M1830_008774 [Pleopsidium flavum]
MHFPTILRYTTTLLLTLTTSSVTAHGAHNQQQQQQQQQAMQTDDADWATRHMAEEHHISSFDPASFFTLHDYDSSRTWTADEIRRTYGLDDESARSVSQEKRDEVVRGVLGVFDRDGDGLVSRGEWMEGWARGARMPDFGRLRWEGGGGVERRGWKGSGVDHDDDDDVDEDDEDEDDLGTGHHGDDEYEYEIHHFEKFHDENTKEEDLIHPEDIAHFKKHDMEADEDERQQKLDRMPIVESNIPQKFRRTP